MAEYEDCRDKLDHELELISASYGGGIGVFCYDCEKFYPHKPIEVGEDVVTNQIMRSF